MAGSTAVASLVVAAYHDQGHVPSKMLGFESGGVSGFKVAVGLPIVRTSVDHGTAFDTAGGNRVGGDPRRRRALAAWMARN